MSTDATTGDGHGLIHVLRRSEGGEDPLRFDRRRTPRYATSGHARVVITGDRGRRLTNGSLVESSACGLAVEMPLECDLGDRIEIFFERDPIPGRVGIVRRCDAVQSAVDPRYRVGIECRVVRAA